MAALAALQSQTNLNNVGCLQQSQHEPKNKITQGTVSSITAISVGSLLPLARRPTAQAAAAKLLVDELLTVVKAAANTKESPHQAYPK